MKAAIRRIDRALKELNNLDQTLRAEDFLLAPKEGRAPAGALYIQEQGDDVSVGIYLNSGVARELGTFPKWKMGELTLDQKRAFAVASEEVSHFHYLLFHLAGGRAVSRLEMELQGEVDTFLLSYFASAEAGKEETAFETAFAQAFEHFPPGGVAGGGGEGSLPGGQPERPGFREEAVDSHLPGPQSERGPEAHPPVLPAQSRRKDDPSGRLGRR
jgi:hypothetical protein